MTGKVLSNGSNTLEVYLGTPLVSTGSGISNVVEDTTPQLGGSLDCNSNNITGVTEIQFDANTKLVFASGLIRVVVSGQTKMEWS